MATKTTGLVVPGRVHIEEVQQGDRLLLSVWQGGEADLYAKFDGLDDGRVYIPASEGDLNGLNLPSAPYEDSVGTEELVQMLIATLRKYVTMPEEFAIVAARYVLLTWCADKFSDIPYLRVLGPGGTGKSRFLDVMSKLVRRGCLLVAPTAPIVYRAMEEVRPTLLMEEATDLNDTIFEILRAGMQQGRMVQRCEGEGRKVRKLYNPFGPKILGAYHRYADVPLEQRCLTHFTARTARDPKVPLRLSEVQAEFDVTTLGMRNMLLKWRFENYDQVKDDGSRVEGVSDRANQVAGALLCLTPEGAHRDAVMDYVKAAHTRTKSDTSDTLEGNVALAILDCWKEKAQPLKDGRLGLSIGDIVSAMPAELGDSVSVGLAAKKMNLEKARTNRKRYVILAPDILDELQRVYGVGEPAHRQEDEDA